MFQYRKGKKRNAANDATELKQYVDDIDNQYMNCYWKLKYGQLEADPRRPQVRWRRCVSHLMHGNLGTRLGR